MYTERVVMPSLCSTVLDSRLCRSNLPLFRLDMMLLGNYLKVCTIFAFYSKWNSSVNSINCAEFEPLFLSHLISHHMAFSHCLLPCSLLLHGKLIFSWSYALLLLSPHLLIKGFLSKLTFGYEKLSRYHVLHITVSILYLSYLIVFPRHYFESSVMSEMKLSIMHSYFSSAWEL